MKSKIYKSSLEFVNDMKRAQAEGYTIYSADYRKANGLLKDFYPEAYGERKLLSYPIGQFIYTLNKMWDEDSQTIVLEEESLRHCFTSGWLAIGEESSSAYINDLEYILPFFAGCKDMAAWIVRLELLREIDDKVIEPFRCRNSDNPKAKTRWQEVEVSWINHLNSKLLPPSPYLQLLTTLGGSTISGAKGMSLTGHHIAEVASGSWEIANNSLIGSGDYKAKEALMDYAVCPMRYIYGYVLDRYPSYQTVFLQNYAVNGLITAIYYLLKDQSISLTEIRKQVDNIAGAIYTIIDT